MNDPCQLLHESWGLDELRSSYPQLHLRFLPGCELSIEGDLDFRAIMDGHEEVADSFSVRIEVSRNFPRGVPAVFETAGRIPADYHKFADGSLCLGSPLRQRLLLSEKPTIRGFIELLLIPYLYNRSCFERDARFPVGELRHGVAGLVQDYERLFNVTGSAACLGMLQMLGLKKRIANKRACPCGSGRRLGRCHNIVLNPLRNMECRRYFRMQAVQLTKQMRAETETTRIKARQDLLRASRSTRQQASNLDYMPLTAEGMS